MNPPKPSLLPLLQALTLPRPRAVGDRWLVAVSGGPDSMALLRVALLTIQEQGGDLVCGHVDHQLRPESGTDSEWVQQQCADLGVRCLVEKVELPAQDGQRTAIEEQARQARYAALTRMARSVGATAVLTGHTADDNAETVLHHLFRGTGLRGLSGIPEVRSLGEGLVLWRPLLSIRREAIVACLHELHQSSLTDSSNSSSAFTRNRVRSELLPWLERELNLRSVEALVRLAEQAAEQQSWIEEEAELLLAAALIQPVTEVVRLHRSLLATAHPVLARECFVRLWVSQNWPRQAMTAEHWHRLVEVCPDHGPPAVQMPGGIDVRRRGEMLVIAGSDLRSAVSLRGSCVSLAWRLGTSAGT